MELEQWKDLMEGIGFVAIVASLIFLGVETRNNAIQAELNTRALQIAARQTGDARRWSKLGEWLA